MTGRRRRSARIRLSSARTGRGRVGLRGAGDARRDGRQWSTNVPSRHSHARRGRMSKALAGLLVALMLGVGLAVGVVAGGLIAGTDSTPPPVAVASASAVPTPSPTSTPSEAPSPSEPASAPPGLAVGRALPVARAEPDARAVTVARARAAHRAARLARRRVAPRGRGDDRRPVRRPPAVGAELRERRLAGARRGRHPALHGAVPGGQPEGGRPGPQLALLLRRLGVRVEVRVRPRRRLAAGARVPPLLEGSRRRGVRRGRVPLRGPLPVADQHPVRAPQRVLGRQEPADDGAGRAGEARRLQAGVAVRARQGPGRAAEGRHDRRPLPRQHDHLQVRPQVEHVPAVGHRREEADRPGEQEARRSQERRDHGRELRPAQRRLAQAPPRGPVHGRGNRVDREQRQDGQGHLAQEVADGADAVLRARTASRSR